MNADIEVLRDACVDGSTADRRRLAAAVGFADAGVDEFGLWGELAVEEVTHRLRWVEPGTFLMGSPDNERGRFECEGPQHKVRLTRGFWLGETPVAQVLWAAVMGSNPSQLQGPEHPIEWVNWHDCSGFCRALEALCPGLMARLPTEAEWEYACRAGASTPTYGPVDEVAWYASNSGRRSRPVAQLRANSWGLYDTLGNVWEWCQDAVRKLAPYSGAPRLDPVMTAGDERVCRGGSWGYDARYLRAASRLANPPGIRSADLGFRLAGGPTPNGARPEAEPTSRERSSAGQTEAP
ncbi:MAG: formylglycine-generating enzyme family protein [Myxococcota bacterium]